MRLEVVKYSSNKNNCTNGTAAFPHTNFLCKMLVLWILWSLVGSTVGEFEPDVWVAAGWANGTGTLHIGILNKGDNGTRDGGKEGEAMQIINWVHMDRVRDLNCLFDGNTFDDKQRIGW